MTGTMRAMVYERFGEPGDVLEIREVPIPAVGDEEVLVRVHTAGVNPLDWHYMIGKPYFARAVLGWRRPKRSIPGNDIAGTVESVGDAVTTFAVGDEVFGEAFGGGLAEYVAVAEEGLVHKPPSLSFEEAASVPVAAFTALQGLRDWGRLQPGADVLIIGASGGVGTFAVQIAKAMGATVTAVCSTRTVETARALGADRVIDYQRESFLEAGTGYDLIFDVPGTTPLRELRRLLGPDGVYVLVGGRKGDWVQPLPRLMAMTLSALLGLMETGNGTAVRTKTDLVLLRDWLESGRISPVIDRNYKLDESEDALTYQGTFHARGKIVVTI
jgi:NADPH:quinone reductase-like Zn-dependent oxidoreductase